MPEVMQQQHQQQQQQPKPRGRRKKIRTEPIRPICPQCEKQFSNQSALTKHKLTHSDERKFACHQCSKAFKRHDHLTGHMQTHSNRKPFNCTIQGCDKTYCDARSLRRHKENIHHIVTPKESSQLGSNNNTNNNSNGNIHQQQVSAAAAPSYQPHQHQTLPNSPSSTTSPTVVVGSQHEQPHLLRRIQRLNSDPGAPHHYSTTNTPTFADRRLVEPINPVYPNSNHHHHQQHHHYQHPQASYSADYASTQQFSFEFEHINNQAPMMSNNNNHHHLHLHSNNQHQGNNNNSHSHVSSSGYVTPTQPGSAMADFATNTNSTQHFLFDFNNNNTSGQLTPNDPQQFSASNGNSLAQSADSLNDSSLGLSIQYEQQQTPMITDATNQQQQSATQATTTPQASNIQHYDQQQQAAYQQQQPIVSPASAGFLSPAVHQEPSHLLQRRIQRLNSDPGAPQNGISNGMGSVDRRLVEPHINPIHHNNHNHHQQHHHYHHPQASYSADYASTQQFSFEFEHINNQPPMANNHHHNNNHHHHQHHNNNHQLNHSHVSSSGYVTPSQPASAMADFATNTNNTQHFLFDFNNNNNQLTQIDQQFTSSNGATIAHSSESLNDSSLGLSIQYEHQGPLSGGGQQQSTQTVQQQQFDTTHQQQQQTTIVKTPNFSNSSVKQEPSHLLQRRIQRLNSDPGAPYHAAH